MSENSKKRGEIFQEFRRTVFYKKWKYICILFHALALSAAASIVKLLGEGQGGSAAVWLAVLLPVCTAAFWTAGWRLYMKPSVRISRIMDKKQVCFGGECRTYDDYLEHIFALLDGSMEREYSARLLQKQTEFEALKSQIHPHFLYNTLDTIRGYALIEDAPNTSHMIEMLSRLFRYMIGRGNELITIGQEIDIIQDYIKIQEYRQNQHILLLQNIDGDLMEKGILDFKIPKMSLEPFIENAVKHGMQNLSKEFVITIQISSTRTRLLIHIIDNGKGMDTEELARLNRRFACGETPEPNRGAGEGKGTGIALTNVNARIKLLYGDEYGVSVQSMLGFGSDFQIMLPLKESDYEKRNSAS